MLQMVRETAAIKIHYIRQREMKGLGDAILCAKAFMGGEPFAVLLGDDVVYNEPGRPALRQLMDVYEATGGSVLGCQTVPQEKVSSYGIVDGIATENERMLCGYWPIANRCMLMTSRGHVMMWGISWGS